MIDLPKPHSPVSGTCVFCFRHKSKENKALIIFAEEQKAAVLTSFRQDVLKQRADARESLRDEGLLTVGTADGSTE